jgi:hypothetical protein
VERSLSSTNKNSNGNQQHRNSSNQNYQNKTNSFFTDEELLELDKFGLPEPVTPENIRIITNRLHEAYHEEKIVCVVCDQIFRISKSRTLNLDELPPSFFTVLLKPTLAKFLRVGSRVELVWLSGVKCDTGESHWCNTSCSRDMERITPVFVLQFILFGFFYLV